MSSYNVRSFRFIAAFVPRLHVPSCTTGYHCRVRHGTPRPILHLTWYKYIACFNSRYRTNVFNQLWHSLCELGILGSTKHPYAPCLVLKIMIKLLFRLSATTWGWGQRTEYAYYMTSTTHESSVMYSCDVGFKPACGDDNVYNDKLIIMTYASLNSPHHMGEYSNIVKENGHVTQSMKSLLSWHMLVWTVHTTWGSTRT